MDFSFLEQNKTTIIWAIIVAVVYVLGGKKDKINNTLTEVISRYSQYLAVLTFLLGFLVTDIYIKQALFTYSSVYLAFWLGNVKQNYDKRQNAKKSFTNAIDFLGNELLTNSDALIILNKALIA